MAFRLGHRSTSGPAEEIGIPVFHLQYVDTLQQCNAESVNGYINYSACRGGEGWDSSKYAETLSITTAQSCIPLCIR